MNLTKEAKDPYPKTVLTADSADGAHTQKTTRGSWTEDDCGENVRTRGVWGAPPVKRPALGFGPGHDLQVVRRSPAPGSLWPPPPVPTLSRKSTQAHIKT